ncbi:MAG TPA: hypothetical protein VG347_07915 [Verrucomicrobiae bacterium]|nr:hypothetical protein [Verrucomicrobiae bacterium]
MGPADPNRQMTALYLFALAVMVFPMMLNGDESCPASPLDAATF